MKQTFASALDDFLAEINGLAISLPVIMQAIGKSHKEALIDVQQYLEKKGTVLEHKEIPGQAHLISKHNALYLQ